MAVFTSMTRNSSPCLLLLIPWQLWLWLSDSISHIAIIDTASGHGSATEYLLLYRRHVALATTLCYPQYLRVAHLER
jgi:hypothetical protein